MRIAPGLLQPQACHTAPWTQPDAGTERAAPPMDLPAMAAYHAGPASQEPRV